MILKNNYLEICQFFNETQYFFEVFEIIETNDPLVFVLFSQNTRKLPLSLKIMVYGKMKEFHFLVSLTMMVYITMKVFLCKMTMKACAKS